MRSSSSYTGCTAAEFGLFRQGGNEIIAALVRPHHAGQRRQDH